MQKQSSAQNFLKGKHISFIGGPILFTAPHSKRLYRGGPMYQQKIRVHERQLYTAWIAAKLADLTTLGKKSEPNSFMVWGKSSSIDQKEMDPNYLLPSMLSQSNFHQSLHTWALKHQNKPILHVDIHGKLNRENDCEIDVGIRSMEVHWEGNPLFKEFKPFFENKLSNIFEGIKYRNFECKFNTRPFLHGYWGGDMVTMTQQAILLGIPSFQLQIPSQVRKSLFNKPQLMQKFAEGIQQFYLKVVIPYYQSKTIPLKISKQISSKFTVSIKNMKDVKIAIEQIAKMQQKYSLNLNQKKI